MATTPPLSSYLPPVPANALFYQKATLNPIGVTAATATNIGYLSKNISQLEVVGQLTTQDPVDIYSFTFQQGSTVKAKITNIDETVPIHFQLLDGSGSRVIADNQGNSTQQAAFTALTSTNGLALKSSSQYVVKFSYGNGAPKSAKQSYALQLDSGTTFKNDYRTLASPTTISATLLAGGSIGYNASTLTASLLTSVSQGNTLNVFDVLGSNATSILA